MRFSLSSFQRKLESSFFSSCFLQKSGGWIPAFAGMTSKTLFTLIAILLVPLAHGENTTAVEIGTFSGASYRIDVPPDWNRRVVVFFHGTSETPVIFRADEALSPMFAPLLQRKYAVIQSGYSAGGWAIEEAAKETEQLRRHFVARHGEAAQFLVMGMSMGGTLTALTIETQPQIYAGALSLCGAIEPSDRLMQREFALAAAFDFYFPGVLPPLVPVPLDYVADKAVTRKIAAALATKPAARAALLRWYGTADAKSLPDVIADTLSDFRDAQQRAHGNPLGNADLIYVNSGDDAALNDGVRRYRADPKASAWLARWYTPSGKLTRPMLAVHDVGDPLVSAASVFEYALSAQRAGYGDNFVQQYVNREGHCVFKPAEIARAFDQLVDWVDNGKRPASGKLP